jgi:predicted Zn finger-like uncharacterized protein
MLLTRCPECDTTFRVTDETLKKASGQVRCGRCASVFNAYVELQQGGKPLEANPARGQAQKTPLPTSTPEQARPAPGAAARTETRRAPEDSAASVGTAAVADISATNGEDAETKVAAEQAATEARPGTAPSRHAMSATDVDRVLTNETAEPVPYVWLHPEPQPRSRWWTVAVAVAAVTLGAQTIHHFRSDIAGHPTFGPWLTAIYEQFGARIAPNWDVHQYEIIDWVATAEPNARGVGSLKITARIQNHGPQRQPYPAVQLRLKDRYEAAVGSRMFTPAEYLPRDTPREHLMLPGETARAEIEVVDPGPDAYGFELDVCIEVEASLVTCGTDEVFL